ncbi:MAG: ABC transporter permease [Hyphomicrobiaceae bacterium]
MSLAEPHAAMPYKGAQVVDGAVLKRRLARAERLGNLRALVLVAPLFFFIVIAFVVPIVMMLTNAVYDPDIRDNLPRTVEALQGWDGKDLPPEATYQALIEDFAGIRERGTAALVGKRMNYEISGIRSKIIASINKASKIVGPPYKDQLIASDKVWGELATWAKLHQAAPAINAFYLLGMLDLQRDIDGNIEQVPENRRVYRDILARTMYISITVTLLTLLLGFPVAYVLANTPPKVANLLMILVLLPFWTSLLVRTTAWFVLLQDNGAINNALQFAGLADQPLPLIFSRFGTIIAMTHIQLPFTLLPIYSVMKGISPSYMRAARSLGGGPIYSFWKVYLPLTLPGIGAGCLLTFILCLGYYITPALVGGPSDQMVSGIIAESINRENNWGKACALGTILLSATLLLFVVYNRLVGIDKVKLG